MAVTLSQGSSDICQYETLHSTRLVSLTYLLWLHCWHYFMYVAVCIAFCFCCLQLKSLIT